MDQGYAIVTLIARSVACTYAKAWYTKRASGLISKMRFLMWRLLNRCNILYKE